MKTALIKTDFWKEDLIFQLTPDVRHFYLCILTNPERNTTPAFKCSDRLMSAYTGFNQETILLCRKQLEEKGLVLFIEGYYLIRDQDFVDTKRGKLSTDKYKEDLDKLPLSVKEKILKNIAFRSRAGLEPLKSIETEIVIETVIETEKEEEAERKKPVNDVSEVIKAMEKVDIKNKLYYNNKTQRDACTFLIENYGKEKVLEMIEGIPKARVNIPYFPSITTPCELRDKWTKIYEAVHRSNKNKKLDMEMV